MSTRVTVTLIGLLAMTILLVLWITCPILARAQCGSIESTCYTCHQATDPVCGTTDWHTVFAHRYACWNCHGGNDRAQDKAQSHVGLVANPLEDAYTSCYPCHPNDYQQRAQQLADEIGIPVSFRDPAPTASVPSGAVASQPLVVPTPAASTAKSNPTDWRQLWWLVPLAVIVPLGWRVWKKQNRI
jgi:hypothetical protein